MLSTTTIMLKRVLSKRTLRCAVVGVALSLQSSARPYSSSSCASDLNNNPLMDKSGLPLFAKIKPEHIIPAIEADIHQLDMDFTALEKSLSSKTSSITYESILDELEKIQAPLSYSWGVLNHLNSVKSSDSIRDAHTVIQPKVISMNQKIGQSQSIYKSLQNLDNSDKNHELQPPLDSVQRRIVSAQLLDMKHMGVGLSIGNIDDDDSSKEKFSNLQLNAAKLGTLFNNNVLDSTKEFQILINCDDKADMDGIPSDTLEYYATTARTAGHENATGKNGPWIIGLDMPSFLPFMKFGVNSNLRKKLYIAYITRSSKGDKDNLPVVAEILKIKKEMANILGYESHAEKSLKTKMAKNVDDVAKLTQLLYDVSYPAAKSDLETLKKYKYNNTLKDNNDGNSGSSEMNPWDVMYWSEKQRAEVYAYDETEIKEYFPLNNVLNGMFILSKRLFNIDITEVPTTTDETNKVDNAVQVWHEDVKFFHIHDNVSKEHIASFYLDPYARPESKRPGAWMAVCLNKSHVMNTIPVAYLTCNNSPPNKEKNIPSLMPFREVETLFHEFGHGLQHMLTEVSHGAAAGISGVEWDAVELPSQFMENWCYDDNFYKILAKHYVTNEPLPEKLFIKIKNAKNYQSGMQMLRQLYFGSMDMHLHSNAFNVHIDENMDVLQERILSVQRNYATKYAVMPPVEEDRFLCSFSHIFGGGYSAGYYSYKWAEVMSADAFGAFEEVGMNNEDDIQKTGKRFRDTVLALGGGTHPTEVFKAFRGRDPNPDALLRHSGLSSK